MPSYAKKPEIYNVVWEFDGTQQSIDDLNAFYGYSALPGLVPSTDRTHTLFELRGDAFSQVTYQSQNVQSPDGWVTREWVELGEVAYGATSVILNLVFQNNYQPGTIIGSGSLESMFNEVGE